MKETIKSVQDWIPIENIFENGIVKLKNKKYIKIIQIYPINFNLKSNLEKESILNSYKFFLKTCNFNIQILVLNSKQDLNKNINNIKNNLEKENKNFLNKIANDYINFIQRLNSGKNSGIKKFYIIISSALQEEEKIIFQKLNENYYKIKEGLFRCGNLVQDLNSSEEIKKLLFLMLNSRFNLKHTDN